MCWTDPVVTPFPLLTRSMTQLQYEGIQAPDWLAAVNNKLKEADAVVVVSAEYNHSIPPALSNMLDHFPPASYAFKPSGIVCYSTGTVSFVNCFYVDQHTLLLGRIALVALL